MILLHILCLKQHFDALLTPCAPLIIHCAGYTNATEFQSGKKQWKWHVFEDCSCVIQAFENATNPVEKLPKPKVLEEDPGCFLKPTILETNFQHQRTKCAMHYPFKGVDLRQIQGKTRIKQHSESGLNSLGKMRIKDV